MLSGIENTALNHGLCTKIRVEQPGSGRREEAYTFFGTKVGPDGTYTLPFQE